MVVFIGFSVLLVFGPVLPASALPPSFSSCLLPTLRFPIYVMCLTCCPCPFFVDLDQSSLPFCATLSFVKVSIVALRALFFTFDDNHFFFFYLNLFICWTGFMCSIRLFTGTNSVEQSLESSPALLDFSSLMVTFIRIPRPCQYRDVANSLLDIGVEDYPDRDLSVHLGLSGLCSILPCHLIQLPVQHNIWQLDKLI